MRNFKSEWTSMTGISSFRAVIPPVSHACRQVSINCTLMSGRLGLGVESVFPPVDKHVNCGLIGARRTGPSPLSATLEQGLSSSKIGLDGGRCGR